MSSDVTHDALRAGAVAGAVLFSIGAIQALDVAMDQLQGPFSGLLTRLLWPGLVIAAVPLFLLGRSFGRNGEGKRATTAGALAGLIAGFAYVLASVLLLLAIQDQPLSSNPGLLPARALPPALLLLFMACLVGALVTVGGAAISHAQQRASFGAR